MASKVRLFLTISGSFGEGLSWSYILSLDNLMMLKLWYIVWTKTSVFRPNYIALGTCWKPLQILKFIRTYWNFGLLYDTLSWMTLYVVQRTRSTVKYLVISWLQFLTYTKGQTSWIKILTWLVDAPWYLSKQHTNIQSLFWFRRK